MNKRTTLSVALALTALGAAAGSNAMNLPGNTKTGPSSPLGTGAGNVEPASFPALWTINQSGSYSYNSTSGIYTFTITGTTCNGGQNCNDNALTSGNAYTKTDYGTGIFDKNSANNSSSYYQIGNGNALNEQFQLSFQVNKNGDLVNSTNDYIKIYGALGAGNWNGYSWSAQPYQLLWSASLSGQPGCALTSLTCKPEVDSNHEALGFTASNFSGFFDKTPFTGGSSQESFWLYTTCGSNTALCGALSVLSLPGSGQWQPNSLTNSSWNSFLAAISSASSTNPLSKSLASSGTFYGMGGIAVVPLPAAGLLLLSALGGLSLLRRKERREAPEAA